MFSALEPSLQTSNTCIMFDNKLHDVVSSGELPSTDWSSIDERKRKNSMRKAKSHTQRRNINRSQFVAPSDYSIPQQSLNQYPSLKDPRMNENLLSKETQHLYPDNGQEYYKVLCKNLNIAPVKLFYSKLITSEINLDNYGLRPAGVRAMAESLTYNKVVRSLTLLDNSLTAECCYHLGEMLIVNTSLQRLALGGCRIGLEGMINLSKGLLYNRGVKDLDLSRNMLGEDGGQILVGCLADDSPIHKLNVSNNSLSSKTANAFCAAHDMRIPKYTHLDLSWNNFFLPRSTEKLLKCLVFSARLKELHMSWNLLEGKRIAGIIGALINSPIIELVDLSNNKFKDVETITALISNLEFAKNLQTLNLSSNPLSPTDAYVVLEKMLTPSVRVRNLLMEDIWVNRSFVKCLESVRNMKERKNSRFQIVYAGMLEDNNSEVVDARELILRRAHFIGVSNKTQDVDIPGYFLKLSRQNPEPMTLPDFVARVSADVPLDRDLLMEMAFTFPVLSRDMKQVSLVDMEQISDVVQRLWPDIESKIKTKSIEYNSPKFTRKLQRKEKR